jgi:HlyD family secretion protein
LTLSQIVWPAATAQAQAADREYILGTAQTRDLTSEYSATGTVEREGVVESAFATPAMVKSVKVKVGDKVAKGDVLATQDSGGLEQKKLQAQAALAQAQAQLYSAEHPAAISMPSSSSSSSSSGSRVPAVPSTPSGTTVSSALMKTLLEGLAKLEAAGKAPATACAPAADGTVDDAACSKAVQDLTDAANAVTALQKQLGAKASAETPSAKTAKASANTSAPKVVKPKVSAAAVARAKAQVLRAQQDLDSAKADLKGATLRAAKAGVVASVGLTSGTMSNGSILVVSDDKTVNLTVDVPLSSRKQIEVGGKAKVKPLGSDREIEGVVKAISPLAVESTSPPAYPVTITVSDPDNLLYSGTPATVTLPLAQAKAAVAVPVSAFTPIDSTVGTVEVIGLDGTQVEIDVAYGIASNGWVEIKDGINPGDQVVLADPSLPLATG